MLFGAIKPHFNENELLPPGWKNRILNTNSAGGRGNTNMTHENQGIMVKENAQKDQEHALDAPPYAPQIAQTMAQPQPDAPLMPVMYRLCPIIMSLP